MFVCQLVELVGEADAIERRLQNRIRLIRGQRTVNVEIEFGAFLFELPLQIAAAQERPSYAFVCLEILRCLRSWVAVEIGG